MRLQVEESRDAAVNEALEAYKLSGNLDSVALTLGVSKRTLERWIDRCRPLREGIESQRKIWGR